MDTGEGKFKTFDTEADVEAHRNGLRLKNPGKEPPKPFQVGEYILIRDSAFRIQSIGKNGMFLRLLPGNVGEELRKNVNWMR